MLDIAKIESGQFSLNLVRVCARAAWSRPCAWRPSRWPRPRSLRFKTEVAKSLPLGLGDEQRLTQVLLNLVGNAIKFTDTGEVRITAGRRNGHFTVARDRHRSGHTAEERNASSSSSTRSTTPTPRPRAAPASGSPSPSRSSRCTVVASGSNRRWVKGATFQMELPIRAEFREARCRMTKRILVVEDQEDLRAILRDLLTGSGYEVVEAADGGEGVAKAKSERPDLILMDIQLPVLDGYEATRQIKAIPDLDGNPDHCGQLIRDEGR